MTDAQAKILEYLTAPWREWTETYVVANSIGMRGKTPAVRRELQRLEKAGKVVRPRAGMDVREPAAVVGVGAYRR